MKPLRPATACMIAMVSLPAASQDQGQARPGFRWVSQQVTTELQADGMFNQRTVTVSENASDGPLAHTAWSSSDSTLVAVFDGEGHELDYTIVREGDVYRTRVTLGQPVEPGGRMSLRVVNRNAKAYLGRNGVYAYGKNHWPGVEIDYEERIIVGPGLRLLHCGPEPEHRSVRDGTTEVVYRRHLRADENFKCRILYLPDESGASKGALSPKLDEDGEPGGNLLLRGRGQRRAVRPLQGGLETGSRQRPALPRDGAEHRALPRDTREGHSAEAEIHLPYRSPDRKLQGLGQIRDAVYTKTGETTLTLAGRSYEAIGLTSPDPIRGGQTELWIDAATGMRLKVTMPGQLTMTLTDASVADRTETYDYDKDLFIKTNRHKGVYS